jgi:competence protein ComEC
MWIRGQPRQPLAVLSLAAIAGILLGEWITPAPWFLAPVLVGAGLAAMRRSEALPGFVVVAFWMLHLLQGEGSASRALARELSTGARTLQFSGIVNDEPRRQMNSRGVVRHAFPMRVEWLSDRGASREFRALIRVQWPGEPPAFGDRVDVAGETANLEPARNPGQFDFAATMRRRGIHSEIRVRDPGSARVLAHGCGNRFYAFALGTRRWMEKMLSLDLDDEPEAASLIRGMVLGSRAETPPEVEDLFRKTGTMHLFAVSGLNVAMFALIAWGVLKTCGLRRRAATPLLIALVLFYATLTGLSASGVRAAIMTSLLLGSVLADRPALALNSLGAAALIILLWDTQQLFATGFQLSFAVVLAIFLCSRPIARWAGSFFEPDPFLPRRLLTSVQKIRAGTGTVVADSFGVSFAAWAGSALLNLHYFHLFSPWTVLANVAVVFLAFFVLATGTLSLIAAPVSVWLAAVFNNANLALMTAVLAVVKFFASWPGSAIYLAWPQVGEAPVASLTVLDMGNGGAAHLAAGGRNWLIDCGSERQYRWITRSYLRFRGINSLDGLMLTHGDIEHIGAAAALRRDYRVGAFLESALRDRSKTRRALQKALAAEQIGRCLVETGDALPIGNGVTARILYPTGSLEARLADDKALVVQLLAAETRILLMSDSGFFTERRLLESGMDLRSEILVKGQHASDLSGTAEFIAAVAPEVVISAAPRSGSAEEWARALQSRGLALFRAEQTGAVEIIVHRGGYKVSAHLGNQVFLKSSR